MKAQIKRAKQRGDKVRVALLKPDIKQKPLPPAARRIWQTFVRLSARRGGTGFGPAPIGWIDLDAYQRMTGIRLSPWQIEMIEMLDGLYLGAVAKNVKSPQESTPTAD